MWFQYWLDSFRPRTHSRSHVRARFAAHRRGRQRLLAERLEDRRLLAMSAPVGYDAGASPHAILSADFNNDGRLDLATANASSANVSVLLGKDEGTFDPPVAIPAGIRPASIAVGDFDGDGNLDLAGVSDSTNPFVAVMFGNGNGTFLPPSYISLGALATPLSEPLSEPMSVAVGDFNEDDMMDIAVSAAYNSHYPGYCCGGTYTQVQVILAHENRTFSAPEVALQSFSGGLDFISPLAVTDFNADDDLDLLVGVPGDYVRIMLGDGEGNLDLAGDQNWVISDPGGLVSMAVGDVDRDSVLDLVAQDLANVKVRLGNGLGGFQSPPGGQSYAAGDRPISVVLEDFDRDGVLDIATANFGSDDVSILRGRGDGSFALPEHFTAGLGAISITAGDFNGDGWLDIATANATGNNVSVLFNNQDWGITAPLVSVSDATVTEGNTDTSSAIFTLTLSRATSVAVSVRYDTANITATAGSDYNAASGTVVIPAGQSSWTVTVAVKGDRLAELTETFAVNLSAATNATIGDGQAIGTIIDNEPRISISDAAQWEGKNRKTTFFTFIATLSTAYDQPVTMSYRTVDGTATASSGDYATKSGTLTFAAGETTKTITIEVKGDSEREANELFYLELFGNSGNSWFGKNRGVGTILNDDWPHAGKDPHVH